VSRSGWETSYSLNLGFHLEVGTDLYLDYSALEETWNGPCYSFDFGCGFDGDFDEEEETSNDSSSPEVDHRRGVGRHRRPLLDSCYLTCPGWSIKYLLYC
jgi:hypothetical protein